MKYQYVTITYANGDKYEGQFVDGNITGQGIFTQANGDKYKGQFVDDKKHGQGIFTQANGAKYDGQFVDDNMNGQGILTQANGAKYEGQYVDGKKHGQGIYTQANGEKYEGQFVDGYITGQGIYTQSNGDKYVGQFVAGNITGQVIFTTTATPPAKSTPSAQTPLSPAASSWYASAPGSSSSSVSTLLPPPFADVEYKCNVCINRATHTCSNCLKTHYCSRECQVEDWPKHKKPCNEMAVSTKKKVAEEARINVARKAVTNPSCAFCGMESFETCANCMATHYCDRACQVKHWPEHKKQCKCLSDEESRST
jgi:hypothetical protein